MGKEEISFGVLLIDIDYFKSVTDTFGHAVGDEVLKYLEKKLTQYSPHNSVCCRYGGEEFVVLFPEVDLKTIQLIAEKLRGNLSQTASPCGQPITVSGGIAYYPDMAEPGNHILEKADIAL